MRFRVALSAVLGLASLAVSSGRLFAESGTISLRSDTSNFSFGGGGELGVTAFGGTSLPPMGLGVSVQGYLFQTFCLERNESLTSNAQLNWSLSSAAHAGGVGGAVSGADAISAETAYLYTRFWNGTLGGYDLTLGSDRIASAGELQAAIWYLEDEYTSDQLANFPQAQVWVQEAQDAVLSGSWSGIGGVRVLTLVNATTGVAEQDVLVVVSNDTGTSSSGGPCPPSSIRSTFNGTSIPANRCVWFSSVMKVSGLGGAEGTIHVTGGTVDSSAFHVALPDATITFSASASAAVTTYDVVTNTWNTVVPVGFGGDVFISGAMLSLPNGLPGGIKPVTWTSSFEKPAGVSLNWKWAAAAYNAVCPSDLGTLNVKPVSSTSLSSYKNSDHAGTPESIKKSVIGGARGGGGSNFTGSYSATGSVCVE